MFKAASLKEHRVFSKCGQIYGFAGESSDRRTHTTIYHAFSGLNAPSGKPAVDKCERKKISHRQDFFHEEDTHCSLLTFYLNFVDERNCVRRDESSRWEGAERVCLLAEHV